jgi:ribosome-associated protein
MDENIKSKTQLKQEADDIQALGIEISKLPEKKILALSLSEDAKEAIIFYQNIKKNSAKRRQAQFIGKVLRNLDLEDVKKELFEIKNTSLLSIKIQHEAESWREKLLSDSESLSQFIDTFSPDLGNLNQIVLNAKKELTSNKKGKNYRNLYRLILESLNNSKSVP